VAKTIVLREIVNGGICCALPFWKVLAFEGYVVVLRGSLCGCSRAYSMGGIDVLDVIWIGGQEME
jgi:hypothetical protein